MKDLPRQFWTTTKPMQGWNYRTIAKVLEEELEILIDTGAIHSAVSEEVLIALYNLAVWKYKLTANHPDWPFK